MNKNYRYLHGNKVFFHLKSDTIYIYTLFFSLFFLNAFCAQGQTRLVVRAKDSTKMALVDSLGYEQMHPNAAAMQEAAIALSKKLNLAGYFEHVLGPIRQANDSLFSMSLERLGKRYPFLLINTQKIDPALLGNSKKDTLKIAVEETQSFLQTITAKLETRGRVFDEVQLTNITPIDGTVVADLTISEEKERLVNKIVIKGYEDFPRSFLRHGSKLKLGTPIQRDFLAKESSALASLPFVNEMKSPEILFENDSSTVYLYLEKAKSNYFDGFIGFNTEEGSGNLKLNGYLDLRLVNNLNKGEALHLNWKNDGREQTNLNINAQIPYIFRSPIGVEGALTIFRKDSTFQNTTLQGKLTYKPTLRSQFNLGISSLESNATQDNLIDTKDLNGTFLVSGYDYLEPELENQIFVNKTRLSVSFGVGRRKAEDQDNQQFKLDLVANRNFKVSKRSSIYLNTALGFLNSEAYFDNEKYRIGGINSIRGFNENSIEATTYSYLNTEFRYLLAANTFFHTITDAAYINDDLTEQDTILYGFGVGLGLRTSSGLFRLNYALGTTDDSTIKFSESKVHISFSSIF